MAVSSGSGHEGWRVLGRVIGSRVDLSVEAGAGAAGDPLRGVRAGVADVQMFSQ